MANNEAAVLAERLRENATAAGAHIVDGHVRTGAASTIPEVSLDADAALALILVTKPRVIYVDETLLELDELLEEAKNLLGLGNDDAMPVALRTAAAPLKKHTGEHCSTSAHFVVDSILHSTDASAFWMEEFESKLEVLVTNAREVSNGDRERVRTAEAAHRPLATARKS